MKSAAITGDINALLRARVAILWIVTREEARVENYLIQACQNAGHIPFTWDCASGLNYADGSPFKPEQTDILPVLNDIGTQAQSGDQRAAWILRDAHTWISGPIGTGPLRALCNIARLRPTMEPQRSQAVLIITPSSDVPPELAGHVTVIEWPSPDREEIAAILDAILEGTPDEIRLTSGNGVRERAIDAAVGLNGTEAAACFSKSLVQHKALEPTVITKEKKRVIAREGVLEWYDPLPGGLDAVGGLELLKGWLISRASAYTLRAREYGLPAPKGCLLVGVPGCGKSLCAKAIATNWAIPLIKLDLNALKSKFVGGSEANLRRALRIIEAIGRCVVWIDEVEKALQGATSGSSDGGVSADALGTVLNWMQERSGEAFVIATANDVESLPPELMRKGRFDDVWFVDLPSPVERASILNASLKTFKRAEEIDVTSVAAACKDYSGAEIANVVPDAMYAAFADGERPITTADLIAAAKTVVPASDTNAEKLAKLRTWAKGRARPASAPATTAAAARKSSIDL
jgi:hypothetical protein